MRPTALALAAAAVLGCARAPTAGTPPAREPTVAELLGQMGHHLPTRRLEAARALAEKGPEVLPRLIEALDSPEWAVRRSATDALAAMGETAARAVPALIETLEDENAWVRQGAAVALGRMGEAAGPAAAEALAEAARDDDLWVRAAVMETLGRGGVTDRKEFILEAAIAVLRCHDTGWAARRFAVGALARHGKDYRPAVPALVYVLEHPSEGMWDCTPRVVELLAGMGAGTKAVAPLIDLLGAENATVRRRAMGMLGSLGEVAAPALPALEEIAANAKDQREREAARAAIQKIQGKDE
ncbi:MAG: HEAT repeat domain-containing protein [Candidatus Brocadiia bacterium]